MVAVAAAGGRLHEVDVHQRVDQPLRGVLVGVEYGRGDRQCELRTVGHRQQPERAGVRRVEPAVAQLDSGRHVQVLDTQFGKPTPPVAEPAGEVLDSPLWMRQEPGRGDPHRQRQHSGGAHQFAQVRWLGGDPVLAGDPADQRDALVDVEHVQRHPVHSGQRRQPPPAGQHHRAPGPAGQQPTHLPSVEYVVEKQKQPATGGDRAKQRRAIVEAVGDLVVRHAQCAEESRQHRGRIGRVVRHSPQVGMQLAVRIARTHLVGDPHGECGLADTAHPDDAGQHGVPRGGQRLGERCTDAVPAGEVREDRRQLGGHGCVGGGRVRCGESGIGPQDPPVHRTESGPGVDAELLIEHPPRVGEHRERVGLAAGLVQRAHEQLTRPLPQRLGGGQLVQLADHAPVPASFDVHLQPSLRRGQPQLAEPPPLALGVGSRHSRQRLAAPPGERRSQQFTGCPEPRFRAQLPSPVHEPLHHRQIDRVTADAQAIPVGDRHQQPRRLPLCAPWLEQPPQASDIGPHHGHHRPRRRRVPHPVHDLVDRHRPPPAQQQHRQHRHLLRRPQVHLRAVLPGTHGTEH